jgi:hypothetical protein
MSFTPTLAASGKNTKICTWHNKEAACLNTANLTYDEGPPPAAAGTAQLLHAECAVPVLMRARSSTAWKLLPGLLAGGPAG